MAYAVKYSYRVKSFSFALKYMFMLAQIHLSATLNLNIPILSYIDMITHKLQNVIGHKYKTIPSPCFFTHCMIKSLLEWLVPSELIIVIVLFEL